MNETNPTRLSPKQLYAIDMGNSLMQRGVNIKEPAVQAWLDSNNPFRVRLMDHYFQNVKFGTETEPLTREDVKGFYADLLLGDLIVNDPTEAEIEAGITLYNGLVDNPKIQRLVRDQVRSQIERYGHGGNILWKGENP